MRVTKRQLRRIIKEERTRLLGEAPPGWGDRQLQRVDDEESRDRGLYVNLTDEQENALNDLDAAMAVCVRAGCSNADVMDTVQGYNLSGATENVADVYEGTSLEQMPDTWRQVLKSCLKDK